MLQLTLSIYEALVSLCIAARSLDLYAEDCQFKTDSLQKLSIMSHVIMLLGFDLLALTRSSSVPTLTLNTMRGYMRNVGHVINYGASRD